MAINLGDIFFNVIANIRNFGAARQQMRAVQVQAQATQQSISQFNVILARLANVSTLLYGPLGGVAIRLNTLAGVAKTVGLSTAALVAGAGAAGYAMLQLGKSAVNAAKVFQKTEMALTAIAGNSRFTAQQLQYLMKISDRTGRSFDSVTDAFIKLEAASKGTNLEGDRTKEIFETITQAGAKLGLSNEEVYGTLIAVQQIMSKGTVQAEELRQQLGDRLPGAFNIMASALGVTTGELNKLMKQNQVTSDALLPFVRELAKRYNVDLTQAIDTTVSAEGRLTNAFMRFSKAADDTLGFSKAYTNTLNGMAGVLDYLGTHFATIIKYGGEAAITLGLLFGPEIAMAIYKVAEALKVATFAMLGLNAAVKGNLLVQVLNLIARLGLAVGGAWLGMKLMDEIMGDTEPTAKDLTVAIQENEKALKEATKASAMYRSELGDQIIAERDAAKAAATTAMATYTAALIKLQAFEQGFRSNQFGDMGNSQYAVQSHQLEQLMLNAQKGAKEAYITLGKLQLQLDALHKIETDLGDNDPLKPLQDPEDSESKIKRIAKALREAQQAIDAVNQDYTTLFGGTSWARDWSQIQSDINTKVQDFHDRLVDAGVAAGDVAAKTDEYTKAVTKLAEAGYLLDQIDFFRAPMLDFAHELSSSLQDSLSAYDKTKQEFIDQLSSTVKGDATVSISNDMQDAINSLGLTADAASDITSQLQSVLASSSTLTDEQAAAIEKLATQMADAQYGVSEFGRVWNSIWDSMANAARKALETIENKLIDMAVNGIFDLLSQLAVNLATGGGSGGGGGLGSLIASLFGGGGSGGTTGGIAKLTKNAGGGSYTIPGGGIGSGMDSQLVAFWGSPGEDVAISKRGHSAGGAGYVDNSRKYVIDAKGAEIGVEEKIVAALKAYDRGSLRRQQANNIKGNFRRLPGMSGA